EFFPDRREQLPTTALQLPATALPVGLQARLTHSRAVGLETGAAAGDTPNVCSGAVLANDGNGGDVALREAPKIVGQTETRLLRALAFAGAALHLQVHLIDHAQTRGANWVAKTLEAAIDLAGDFAIRVVEPVEHIFDGAAFRGDVQILH